MEGSMTANRGARYVIQRVAAVLKERYRPERIVLFGSYASGRPRKDSDIDLLIVKQTSKPFFRRLAEVRRLVSETRRGYPFEPVVITPAELRQRLESGDQFLEEILQTGHLLYAGKA